MRCVFTCGYILFAYSKATTRDKPVGQHFEEKQNGEKAQV